jgi:quercetin dioxygenase-like cupin family protein
MRDENIVHFLTSSGKSFSTESDLINEKLLFHAAQVREGSADWKPSAIDSKPKACAYLDNIFNTAVTHSLLYYFSMISAGLRWREAPKGKLGASMDDNHAFCEVVGPEGQLFSDQLRLGGFLLAPNTDYPHHAHVAEEIYLPIYGIGKWAINDSPYITKKAGDTVHIPSWTRHAIHTQKDPLLMLWAWVGDLDFSRYTIELAES